MLSLMNINIKKHRISNWLIYLKILVYRNS